MDEHHTQDNTEQTPPPSDSPETSNPDPIRGIVYIMENPAMPGYVKLGKTEVTVQGYGAELMEPGLGIAGAWGGSYVIYREWK